MNRQLITFINRLALFVIVFEGNWVLASSPSEDGYKSYRIGDTKQQQACIERLIAMSDEGLPFFEKLFAFEENRGWSGLQSQLLIEGVIRVGTEKAADVLMTGAERHRGRIGYGDMDPVFANALARMGSKGLTRLLILSKQTEAYREPWFMPEWRKEKFIWFPKKQWRPTASARAARAAVASVSDPAAVPVLVRLVDTPEMCNVALQALTSMKVAGIEEKAVRIWEADRNAVALKYLLLVNREKYLPILQEKLKVLDDEVARLLRDLAELRAKKVRDTVADDSVIDLVLRLGGDPAANDTLRRYVESRLWWQSSINHTGLGDRRAGDAVMALGLSKAADAKPTLLNLLKDTTPLDGNYSRGFPRLDGSGRGSGVPMFIVALRALEKLGDPSVIPIIEQHGSANDPLFRRCFEEVLSTLRAVNKANQVPEDMAHKLADPQH